MTSYTSSKSNWYQPIQNQAANKQTSVSLAENEILAFRNQLF
jgi:hypothetical protein